MKRQVVVVDDGVFEILENELLSHKPYLLRIYSYNNSLDIRITKQDLKELVKLINSTIEENNDTLQLD